MDVEKKVFETIKKYKLLKKSDKIVVALSGGKDSTSILYILKNLGYDVYGLMINLYLGEWSEIHKRNMEAFCSGLNVPLTVVDLKAELGQGICFIKAVLKKRRNLTGCTVCGIVKRWILNKWAKKLGGDKIVTGHNLDDEAQNVLMNFLKGNVCLGARSGPKTGCVSALVPKCVSAGFVQRVKPLFFVAESEIRKYAKRKGFDILYDRCPCAFETYRVDTREWMSVLSDAEKLAIVEGWQAKIGDLRSALVPQCISASELRKCKECGEPSTGELCSFCGIVGCL